MKLYVPKPTLSAGYAYLRDGREVYALYEARPEGETTEEYVARVATLALLTGERMQLSDRDIRQLEAGRLWEEYEI